MKTAAFIRRFLFSQINAIAAVPLIMLAWSIPVVCGPIHDAARDGDLAKVKSLLQMQLGAVSSKDDNGNTPLHCAAENGHKDVVALLLANKAEVNAKNNQGETPLHVAASKGKKDIAELLLAGQADANAKNSDGVTALRLAEQKGNTEIAELLRQHGGAVGTSRGAGAGDNVGSYAAEPGTAPPKPLVMPMPSYTEEAKMARIEGIISLEVIIRANGSVEVVRIVKGLGYGLDEAAIDTVEHKWRFQPATRNNVPYDVKATIETRFRLF
jgi:TonB family protein